LGLLRLGEGYWVCDRQFIAEKKARARFLIPLKTEVLRRDKRGFLLTSLKTPRGGLFESSRGRIVLSRSAVSILDDTPAWGVS
jgi:hypothetical protein